MSDENARRFIGTWKLISAMREEHPSGFKVEQFGSGATGFLNYSPDGRMLALLVRGDRKRPSGFPVSKEEAAGLFRGLVSYGGRWEVKGDEVFHHVDISANEIWTGTEQQRFYRFDGDRLSLSTPVNPDPIDGKMSVRSMLWEKVK
jgi:hypothetical protein